VWNVGVLIGNLQSLEFSARVAIATITGSQSGVDLRALQPGQWVPEDPMTNYDQLTAVLEKFNALVSPRRRPDIARIVDLVRSAGPWTRLLWHANVPADASEIRQARERQGARGGADRDDRYLVP